MTTVPRPPGGVDLGTAETADDCPRERISVAGEARCQRSHRCRIYRCRSAGQPIDGSLAFRLPTIDNHIQNWFDCIKSRAQPIADVEIGHRSASLCHLGNIARWVGRKLTWDPAKEIFPKDEEANGYLDRPRRKPYELPAI